MKARVLLLAIVSLGSILLGMDGYGIYGPMIIDTANPSLSLTSPVGGEEWYIGGTFPILWQASDGYLATEPVSIWYNSSGGDFIPIAISTENDGIEEWLAPTSQNTSVRIKIRVVDAYGNYTERLSGFFGLGSVPPLAPQGTTLDVSNGIDAVISWLPVTQNMLGAPIVPEGYIVLYSEEPYAADNLYYFLGETSSLSYTHHRVVLFRSDMYYKVIAYLGPLGNLADYVLAKWRMPDPHSIFDPIGILPGGKK